MSVKGPYEVIPRRIVTKDEGPTFYANALEKLAGQLYGDGIRARFILQNMIHRLNLRCILGSTSDTINHHVQHSFTVHFLQNSLKKAFFQISISRTVRPLTDLQWRPKWNEKTTAATNTPKSSSTTAFKYPAVVQPPGLHMNIAVTAILETCSVNNEPLIL
ncbi:hypothetical protein CBL_00933 [Carabus blaptoides fortunei]